METFVCIVLVYLVWLISAAFCIKMPCRENKERRNNPNSTQNKCVITGWLWIVSTQTLRTSCHIYKIIADKFGYNCCSLCVKDTYTVIITMHQDIKTTQLHMTYSYCIITRVSTRLEDCKAHAAIPSLASVLPFIWKQTCLAKGMCTVFDWSSCLCV